ncbi:hypothetical protein FBF91_08010 [Campylobacter upsaliensis]|uniref:YopX family protein n=1 Tax=Campylobacter upsaliensis TaxID=28080 RepID=UPI0012C36254|nr:YopX family protein [Campylobacter upsaliensis]EAK7296941.1 hypothetical protein [Campylobacter upsaliensis]MBJ6809622.1 hypothetical protein [Campylobacter upsaliensis]
MKLRDFSFRAFDTEKKSYIDFKITSHDSTGMLDIHAYPHIEVELWSGYFDKNGKKIYEGDIIKYVYIFDHALLSKDKIKRLPKKVSEGYVGFNEFLGFRILKNKELQCFMKDVTNIEIIGNIHENADLLKEQDEAKRKEKKK